MVKTLRVIEAFEGRCVWLVRLLKAGLCCLFVTAGEAAAWSDASVGYRYGTDFAEPYEGSRIAKNIFNVRYVNGYAYGTNFFNADLLFSNGNDPASPGSGTGAHEAYVVYRHTLDFSRVIGRSLSFGPVKGFGAIAGFDLNAKHDAGYNSRKRMLALGLTLMADVPGFLNVSVLQLWESNEPYDRYTGATDQCNCRYHYRPHPELDLNWSIPFHLGNIAFSYEGYADFISAKGKDEFGNGTVRETNIDSQFMYDFGRLLGKRRGALKAGFEYQYWKNKFGNSASGPAGSGAYARTKMIRVEYHY